MFINGRGNETWLFRIFSCVLIGDYLQSAEISLNIYFSFIKINETILGRYGNLLIEFRGGKWNWYLFAMAVSGRIFIISAEVRLWDLLWPNGYQAISRPCMNSRENIHPICLRQTWILSFILEESDIGPSFHSPRCHGVVGRIMFPWKYRVGPNSWNL